MTDAAREFSLYEYSFMPSTLNNSNKLPRQSTKVV